MMNLFLCLFANDPLLFITKLINWKKMDYFVKEFLAVKGSPITHCNWDICQLYDVWMCVRTFVAQ